MYEMLIEYGGKIPPSDQVVLDDTNLEVDGACRIIAIFH